MVSCRVDKIKVAMQILFQPGLFIVSHALLPGQCLMKGSPLIWDPGLAESESDCPVEHSGFSGGNLSANIIGTHHIT